MKRWFERFYDCESYGFRPKTEIVQNIIREYPGPYLVIGDRKQDLECARSCGSLFAGCLYGYGDQGELDGADYLAEHVGIYQNYAIWCKCDWVMSEIFVETV